MSGPIVAIVAVAGLGAGLFVAEIAYRLPDPAPLRLATRAAIAVVHSAAWAMTSIRWERWWQVVPYALLGSTLVCVSVIDLRVYRIPNRVVFPSLALSFALVIVATWRLEPTDSWAYFRGALVGTAVYFALLLVPHLIYPKGLGMGDVKLALVMGLYLGWGRGAFDAFGIIASALFVGCLLGVVSGVLVNAVRKRNGAFPFGPSLAAGCFFVLMQATGSTV
ncbi:MAG: prepilin peptidase [Acidimicrobiales bacterium]